MPTYDENMLRLEFKLDLVLHTLRRMDPVLGEFLEPEQNLLQEYDRDLCPACNGQVSVTVDLQSGGLTRTCNCRSGRLVVRGIEKLFAPPPPPAPRVPSGADSETAAGTEPADDSPPQVNSPSQGKTP